MASQTGQSDINFSADDAHRFLPWLVGIMVCLAAMLLCLSLSVSGWIVDRGGSYAGSFTVNVPADTANLTEALEEIRGELRNLPHVTGVTQVSEGELKKMLEPWLGDAEEVGNLPLPVVLDVTLSDPSGIDYARLGQSLAAIAPGTEVDAHERWVAAFSEFSAAAQCLIALFAVLILVAIAVMIAFTSRASLRLHARTVHLLHSIGAGDDYITRQFQREALRLALPGAAMGCLAAGGAYWLAGVYMASLGLPAMPSLAMNAAHLALLLLMPAFCGMVAWAGARFSIAKQLQGVL